MGRSRGRGDKRRNEREHTCTVRLGTVYNLLLGRYSQRDHHREFQANQDCTARPCLKKKQAHKSRNKEAMALRTNRTHRR